MRHDFPSEWAKFQSVTIGGATPTAELDLVFRAEHYPFWSQGIVDKAALKGVQLFAESAKTQVTVSDANAHADTLVRNPLLGNLLSGKLSKSRCRRR